MPGVRPLMMQVLLFDSLVVFQRFIPKGCVFGSTLEELVGSLVLDSSTHYLVFIVCTGSLSHKLKYGLG